MENLDFRNELAELDEEISNILNGLLKFNPYFRATPSKLLSSPVFDSIRSPKRELKASDRIIFECDKKGAFDYDSLQPLFHTNSDLLEALTSES